MDLSTFEGYHRQRHRDTLRYATAIVGPDRAEDACQEAWLRAWRAWGKAEVDHVDAWVLRIVRNCCLDRVRSTRPTLALSADELPLVPPIDDAVLDFVQAEESCRLLQQLPAQLREVLWLREVIDLSYAQIAEVQQVPIGTVMSRLHAARKKAARLLARADR